MENKEALDRKVQIKWKSITNFNAYEVSNTGIIKRVLSKTGRVLENPRILKPGIANTGYLHISLSQDGRKRTSTVHVLVYDEFGDGKRNGRKRQIDHLDANKTNNNIHNLESVRPGINVKRAVAMGLRKSIQGTNHVASKLTKQDVVKVRKLYEEEELSYREIGKIFGMSASSIGKCVNKETYAKL